MHASSFEFHQPDWVSAELESADHTFLGPEDKMSFVVRLSQLNSRDGAGGPFAAAVFDLETNRLVTVGVNRVVASHCSLAHAEMVALALAQRALETHDLSAAGQFELVSTTEPCAMCLGALPWSGIAALVCGAREEDARAVGFDEGDKPADWINALERRGIAVLRDIERSAAREVLQAYAADGGPIYNAGDTDPGDTKAGSVSLQ